MTYCRRYPTQDVTIIRVTEAPDDSETEQVISCRVSRLPAEPDVGIMHAYCEVDCLVPGVELTRDEEDEAIIEAGESVNDD